MTYSVPSDLRNTLLDVNSPSLSSLNHAPSFPDRMWKWKGGPLWLASLSMTDSCRTLVPKDLFSCWWVKLTLNCWNYLNVIGWFSCHSLSHLYNCSVIGWGEGGRVVVDVRDVDVDLNGWGHRRRPAVKSSDGQRVTSHLQIQRERFKTYRIRDEKKVQSEEMNTHLYILFHSDCVINSSLQADRWSEAPYIQTHYLGLKLLAVSFSSFCYFSSDFLHCFLDICGILFKFETPLIMLSTIQKGFIF